MKKYFLILVVLLVWVMGSSAWGACPEDTSDLGLCDSVYLDPWLPDLLDANFAGGGPYFVRVGIYIVHDVADEATDSIAGMQFPLCYTHTNPANYCSLSSGWNTTVVSTNTKSIFRHLVEGSDVDSNWMLRQKTLGEDAGDDWVWSTRILNLDGISYYQLLLVPSVQPSFGESGNKWLMATMTFKIQDTMTVYIDTCYWSPGNPIQFARPNGKAWAPRMGTPHDPSSYKVTLDFSDVKEIQGSDDEVRPSQFHLSQNYPNPFNPVTNFQFTLSKSGHVKIDIFNIVGQRVRTLVDKDMKPGVYVADWDGKDENGNSVSSGIYFYRMQAGEFSNMKKMVLLK
jgi:hypothetical protein